MSNCFLSPSKSSSKLLCSVVQIEKGPTSNIAIRCAPAQLVPPRTISADDRNFFPSRLDCLASLCLTGCIYVVFQSLCRCSFPFATFFRRPGMVASARAGNHGQRAYAACRMAEAIKITEGKDRGRLVPLSFRQDPANQHRWKLVFGDYAAVWMTGDGGGGLAMERLDLIKSRSYIVYEPALPILPRDLASGASLRRSANFKMFDAESGQPANGRGARHISSGRFPIRNSIRRRGPSTAIISRSNTAWICSTRSSPYRWALAAGSMKDPFTEWDSTLSKSSASSRKQRQLRQLSRPAIKARNVTHGSKLMPPRKHILPRFELSRA